MEASGSRSRRGRATQKRYRGAGSGSGSTAQSLNDDSLRSIFSRLDDHFDLARCSPVCTSSTLRRTGWLPVERHRIICQLMCALIVADLSESVFLGAYMGNHNHTLVVKNIHRVWFDGSPSYMYNPAGRWLCNPEELGEVHVANTTLDRMDGHHGQHVIQLGIPCHPGSLSTPPLLLTEGRTPNMCPALYIAVCGGRIKDVMARLQQQERGAASVDQATGITQHGRCDILESSAEGNTVFHVAAEQGHGDLIQELERRFGDRARDLLPRLNSALDTPLHCAARAGSVRAVRTLIELARDRGEWAVLGCKNEAGDTALHLSARHGHHEAVEALVIAEPAAAAELNNAGVSPLYLAVISGSERALKAIVTHCSDASCAGPSSQNALHAAVLQRKGSKMVEILLNWRPALAAQVDSSGSSPLHFASSDGDLSIVRAILRGAPSRTAYQKDAAGLSALHIAALMGHDRVVKELLERCPDAAELRDGGGGTFLHAAAREKRTSVVSLAFKKKRCCTFLFRTMPAPQQGLLNAQDKEGNTPLHLAVAAGAPGIVEALLWKGGVRVDVLNNAGNTALDLVAKSSSYFTMVSLVGTLVAYKAQPRPQRQDHLTPWITDGIKQAIGKTSDSLTVVAVLFATAAFAAGFNLPGGYGNDGMANLKEKTSFKVFLLLDTVAAATSVAAVVLLVYGKASCSAGSWKSFVAALHCMWVSLISMMMAFYAALVAVAITDSEVFSCALTAVHLCVPALALWVTWIAPVFTSWWRFLWQSCLGKGRHVMKRQYPLATAAIPNFCLFKFANLLSFVGFLTLTVIRSVEEYKA